MPLLHQLLGCGHEVLVVTALTLIFRMNMMRSSTIKLLQEVVLLQSQSMVALYRHILLHTIILESFFRNKNNLKGQWCSVMRQEVEWFISKCSPQLLSKQGSSVVVKADGSEHNSSDMEDFTVVQDILRTLKVHEMMCSILESVASSGEASDEISAPIYTFLRGFCASHPKNQVALYKSGSLLFFVRQLPEDQVCQPFRLVCVVACTARRGEVPKAAERSAGERGTCWGRPIPECLRLLWHTLCALCCSSSMRLAQQRCDFAATQCRHRLLGPGTLAAAMPSRNGA